MRIRYASLGIALSVFVSAPTLFAQTEQPTTNPSNTQEDPTSNPTDVEDDPFLQEDLNLPEETPPENTPNEGNPETPDDGTLGSVKEKEGREAFASGKYDLAIAALLESYELSQKPELIYLVAKSFDAKGDDIIASKTYYEQYLAITGGNPPELLEIQARIRGIDAELASRRAAAAEASKGKLLLVIDKPGASVEIEDKGVGTSPLTSALTYTEGAYTLRVTKEGYKEYLGVVDVEAGDENRVEIFLEKEKKPRWGLWTAIALGVVAGGVGTTLAIVSGNDAGQGTQIPGSDLGNIEF